MNQYNPLVPFKAWMIPKLKEIKHTNLVTQTYPRGKQVFSPAKIPVLISAYDNTGSAQRHLQAIVEKEWKSLINLNNETHYSKLIEMCGPDTRYLLYAALIKDKKDVSIQHHKHLRQGLYKYITTQTSWRPGAGETIRAKIEFSFGYFFLRVHYNGHVIVEKLEVFEQLNEEKDITIYSTQSLLPPYQITF